MTAPAAAGGHGFSPDAEGPSAETEQKKKLGGLGTLIDEVGFSIFNSQKQDNLISDFYLGSSSHGDLIFEM